jgi:hypothetical protein
VNKGERDDVDVDSIVAVLVSDCTLVIEDKIVSVITDELEEDIDENAVLETEFFSLAETDALCDERGVTLTDVVTQTESDARVLIEDEPEKDEVTDALRVTANAKTDTVPKLDAVAVIERDETAVAVADPPVAVEDVWTDPEEVKLEVNVASSELVTE